MLLPSVFLIPLLYQPSNEKYPFGHMQLETVFVVVKGITMSVVTIGMIANSINILFHGGHRVAFDVVAWFELAGMIISIMVALYLKRKNRTLNSPIIETEMQGWKIDSVISMGMTLAFFLPILVPFEWFQKLTPYLDSILAIVLSLIMLPEPIGTVVSGIRDLLLISPDEETIQEIRETIEPELKDCSYSELYFEVVKTGRKLWISAYIKLEKDELSVRRFKMYQNRCIAALAQKYTDFYFELLPEIEFDEEEIRQLTEEGATE